MLSKALFDAFHILLFHSSKQIFSTMGSRNTMLGHAKPSDLLSPLFPSYMTLEVRTSTRSFSSLLLVPLELTFFHHAYTVLCQIALLRLPDWKYACQQPPPRWNNFTSRRNQNLVSRQWRCSQHPLHVVDGALSGWSVDSFHDVRF